MRAFPCAALRHLTTYVRVWKAVRPGSDAYAHAGQGAETERDGGQGELVRARGSKGASFVSLRAQRWLIVRGAGVAHPTDDSRLGGRGEHGRLRVSRWDRRPQAL